MTTTTLIAPIGRDLQVCFLLAWTVCPLIYIGETFSHVIWALYRDGQECLSRHNGLGWIVALLPLNLDTKVCPCIASRIAGTKSVERRALVT